MRVLLLIVALLCSSCTPSTAPVASSADEPFYAPDFTLSSLDGTNYTLSELRGQWVIINFWATWCAPCIREMPVLQEIADNYVDTVTLLGVNMREDTGDVQAFIETNVIRYPILIHPDTQILLDYNVTGLPQTLIVAPDGELVYRSFGEIDYERFTQTLNELIASF